MRFLKKLVPYRGTLLVPLPWLVMLQRFIENFRLWLCAVAFFLILVTTLCWLKWIEDKNTLREKPRTQQERDLKKTLFISAVVLPVMFWALLNLWSFHSARAEWEVQLRAIIWISAYLLGIYLLELLHNIWLLIQSRRLESTLKPSSSGENG